MVRRTQPDYPPGEVWPLEEGYCVALGRVVGIEQVAMVHIVLIHAELYPPESEDLRIEPSVYLLVGSYQGDMVEPLDEARVLSHRDVTVNFNS